MTPRPAERILTDAAIWTGAPGEETAREGWAIALGAGRVLAVGRDAEVRVLRDRDTEIVSLPGRALLPGFIDAHVHLQAGGLALGRVDLRGVRRAEELVRRVADRAASTPPGTWILGGAWDHHAWGGTLPTRSWLDRAAPGRPALLLRTDLHVGVASSRALALAGVGPDTPDPERGAIDREADGRTPTGVLRESALDLVSRVVPQPGRRELEQALRAAVGHALAHGVTGVHDMGVLGDRDGSRKSLDALRRMHGEGGLPMRVYAALPLADADGIASLVREEGTGDDRMGWGLAKGFVDGSLGASTAWFHEPYMGDPAHCGAPISDPEVLRRAIGHAVELGLHPAVHAIGDRATDWLLSVYEALAARSPEHELRLRMEHAQHMTPDGIRRAGSVPGLDLSVQPAHLTDDAVWAEARLGAARVEGAFAWGSLAAAGARLAFGSDWPVAPMDPLATVAAAVERRPAGTPAGASWGHPRERLSLAEALRAHTVGAARAGPMPRRTGTLEPGMRGDLVVLSSDPLAARDAAELTAVRVEATFVDGAPVWEAGAASGLVRR